MQPSPLPCCKTFLPPPEETLSSSTVPSWTPLFLLQATNCILFPWTYQKIGTAQKSISGWGDTQMVVHSYSRLLLSHEEEWGIDTQYSMDEPQRYHVEWEKPDTKGRFLNDPIYMKYPMGILQHLFWAWYYWSGPHNHLLLSPLGIISHSRGGLVSHGESEEEGLRLMC